MWGESGSNMCLNSFKVVLQLSMVLPRVYWGDQKLIVAEPATMIIKRKKITAQIDSLTKFYVSASKPSWNVNHSHPSNIWQNFRHPLAVNVVVSRMKMLSLHSPSTKQTSTEKEIFFMKWRVRMTVDKYIYIYY